MVFVGVPRNMQHILVLGGTGEARQLIKQLSEYQEFRVTASLVGATEAPALFEVETRIGGFGGVHGLADWVKLNAVDTILDMTHPYAAKISSHVAIVAQSLSIPAVAFHRPSWYPIKGDNWQEFDSWKAMVAAFPLGAKVFLAGGSRSLEPFCARSDLSIVARGLNININEIKYNNISILNKFPNKLVEEEIRVLRDGNITHIACKNSGGGFSRAKLDAARCLGLPVWMLKRPNLPTASSYYKVVKHLNLVAMELFG